MKIRNRLKLNTWISLSIIALMALSLTWSFTALQRAARDTALTAEMQRVARDRAAYRDYYLNNGTDRARNQWLAASGTLKSLLESASNRFKDEEDQALLREAVELLPCDGRHLLGNLGDIPAGQDTDEKDCSRRGGITASPIISEILHHAGHPRWIE